MAMRQALHIFRKDVRYLRWEILIVLGAVAGVTYATIRAAGIDASWRGHSVMAYLLPVAWWVLVARLILAEPLPGDRQFWVTRPYRWKSLLAAKALFILTFVCLPKLVSDLVILRAWGFDLQTEVAGLLWSQFLVAAVFVLPVAALCAVTTGFVQLVGVALGMVLAVAAWNQLIYAATRPDPWFRMEWAREYSMAIPVIVAAMAIVLWQYALRATAKSRILAASATLTVLVVWAWLPWQAGFAVQSGLSSRSADASDVRVEFDPDEGRSAVARIDSQTGVELSVPIRVTGRLGSTVAGVVAEIEGPSGRVWRSYRRPASQVRSSYGGTWIRVRVDEAFYQAIKDEPVRIHGTAYLTLFGSPRNTVLPVEDHAGLQAVAGIGVCAAVRSALFATPAIVLDCRSSFRSPRGDVSFGVRDADGAISMPQVHNLSSFRRPSYSPFPAEFGLIPVQRTVRYVMAGPSTVEAGVGLHEPVAHVSRDFEIDGVRFADYEEPE